MEFNSNILNSFLQDRLKMIEEENRSNTSAYSLDCHTIYKKCNGETEKIYSIPDFTFKRLLKIIYDDLNYYYGSGNKESLITQLNKYSNTKVSELLVIDNTGTSIFCAINLAKEDELKNIIENPLLNNSWKDNYMYNRAIIDYNKNNKSMCISIFI